MSDDIVRSPEEARRAHDAEAQLRGLIEQDVPPLGRAQEWQLRGQVAARIEQLAAETYARRARSGRRRRWLGVAAALLAATLGIVFFVRGRAVRSVAAQVTALRGSVEIAVGDATRPSPALGLVPIDRDEELRTGDDAMARASLATGATVEIGPSARVKFTPTSADRDRFDDTIALERGRIAVDVPPLRPGVTLSVRTADAIVTVHGTRFSVERTVDPAGTLAETRVAVVEGRVSVRRGDTETMLTPGQTWSSRVEAPDTDAPDGGAPDARGSTAGVDVPPRDEPTAGSSSAAHDPPRAPQRTTLTAENELLEGAMDARRRGRPQQAIERLDRLLSRYPDSPLAEIARVERLRAIEMLGDRGRATSEARRYLNDYPHGFARDEAATASHPGAARP